MELTNQQWSLVESFFEDKELKQVGRGRPRVQAREILEGILWVLRTGAPWKDMPSRYPAYQTCHRRFQEWIENDIIDQVLEQLIQDLESRGKIDVSECFIDGSFASAKKGVLELVRQSEERGPRSWQLRTAMVFLSDYPLEVLHRMKLR